MKIWGNDLKVGDTIYYERDYGIIQSTVKEKETKTVRMHSLILENGDRIFVNDYYYTDKQDVIDSLLTEVIDKCKNKIEHIKKTQMVLDANIILLNNKLDCLNNFNK
jgi:hypothetical protein